jgi:tetratricopeptide (TPR) repeat protein
MLHTIGQVYGNLGMLDEAITLLRQALVMRGHIDLQSLGTAETAASLAASLRERGDWDEAQRAYETALTVMRQRYGARDIHVIVMLQGLAEVLSARGDLDSAEAAFRELLEALRRSPHGRGGLPGCLNALGGILSEKGENAEAIPLLREALQISRESQSGDWATLMAIRGNLAWLLALTGQNDEAESIIQDELAQRRRLLPPKHASIATSLITSAVIHMNRGRPIEAEPLFREAVEIRESALPANHPDVTEARGLLGDCLTKTRQYDEAERLLVACAQALRNTPGHSQTALAEADRRLIRLYEASGQTTKAESWRSRVQVQRSDSASRPAP